MPDQRVSNRKQKALSPRLLGLVGLLLGLLFLALLRPILWPIRTSQKTLEQHLAEVAARPDQLEPRVALIRYLTEAELTFGAAMEMALLPPSAPQEVRLAAVQAFLRLDQLEKATELSRKLYADAPSPTTASQLITLLREQGRFAEVKAVAEQAAGRWPDDPSLVREQLRALLDLADYGAVLKLAEAESSKHPQDVELRSIRGWAEFLNGSYDQALRTLDAIPAGERSPWIEVLRGRALMRRPGGADFKGAEAAFSAALQQSPGLYEPLLGLAEIRQKRSDWKGAVEAAGQAASLRPDSPAAWRILAQGHARLGETPEAEWARGRARLAAEQPEGALPHLSKAVSLVADAAFQKELASGYFATGRRSAGYQVLAQAMQRRPDPELARFWYNTAFDKGDMDDALKAGKALSHHPEPRSQAEALALVAQVQRDRGQPHEALGSLNRALELVPNEPVLLAERGRTYLAMRDPESLNRAEADLKQAAAGAPQVPPLYFDLGSLAQAKGRPAEAFQHLCRNLTLLRNEDLNMPLSVLTRVCAELKLSAEAKWCADWARQLQKNEDRLRALTNRPPDPASDRELGEVGMALLDYPLARAAYSRVTRGGSATASDWLQLAAACQRMGLYDERVAAMEKWRSLSKPAVRKVARR